MSSDGFLLRVACLAAGWIVCIAVLTAACRRRADRDAALFFPLPGVAEALAVQAEIPLARARKLEWEFRRWFAAAAASPVMIGMCSQEVDSFWHELLWRPSLYEAYSRAVCGRILRHVEDVGSEVLDARCWAAYHAMWGDYPPADIWGTPPSAAALARVRAKADSSSGDSGGASLSVCDGYSHDGSCDAGSHGGADGGGHGCGGGGHGCGGH
jgi:hypothetical protein